jgi:hypothetical protein
MGESESSCTNFTIIVKVNVCDELLTTDTVLLATRTFDLNLNELFDLVIKVKYLCFVTSA